MSCHLDSDNSTVVDGTLIWGEQQKLNLDICLSCAYSSTFIQHLTYIHCQLKDTKDTPHLQSPCSLLGTGPSDSTSFPAVPQAMLGSGLYFTSLYPERQVRYSVRYQALLDTLPPIKGTHGLLNSNTIGILLHQHPTPGITQHESL